MVKPLPFLKNKVHDMVTEHSKDKVSGKQYLIFIFNLAFRLFELIFGQIFAFIYRGPGEAIPPISSLILLDSATKLAAKIRTKKLTSEEVVKSFISRILEINPVLNCVVDNRFQEALEDARHADALIASGLKTKEDLEFEKPFLGVPFTVKDSIGVKGLSNTAGLWRRKSYRPTEDADVVARMRKAGAIPLAVTNVSELCMFWESYNKVFGRTRNAYNTNRIVGGSSGGEGCLLSAAGSPMGFGSDIAGSVRMPAFFNGVFGHKTSSQVGSLKGHYPLPTDPNQLSYLTIGPMSRFATDLLPMLKVLAPSQIIPLKLDQKVNITQLNYFYMEDDNGGLLVSPVEQEIKACVRKVVGYLKATHSITAQKLNFKKLQLSMAMWFAKMKPPGTECQMPEELANREKPFVSIWKELLKLVLGCSHHTLPVLLVGLMEKVNVRHGSPQHLYLVNMCSQLQREFQDVLGTDGVFLYPTHPTAAPYHVEPLIKPFNVGYTAIFNVIGLPATHCPLGLNNQGLPIGLQVVAGPNQDRLTLAVAVELEKAFGGWVPTGINV